MKATAAAALMLSFAAISLTSAEDILLHSGPEITTPKLRLLSPAKPKPDDGEEMTLIKEFFVSPEVLANLAAMLPALTREEVAALATASIRAAGPERVIEITKVQEFQAEPDGAPAVGYHLVTVHVDGSEEHLVVLADETVLKPRLRRLSEK